MKKITPFFIKVQPSRTILPEQQHEEMEWEEQESVMSDMEDDPHDWLNMEKSRDRAIRLRRASCQKTTWMKLQKEKEDSLRVLTLTFRRCLIEIVMKEWSKSMLVTLASARAWL